MFFSSSASTPDSDPECETPEEPLARLVQSATVGLVPRMIAPHMRHGPGDGPTGRLHHLRLLPAEEEVGGAKERVDQGDEGLEEDVVEDQDIF